MSVLLKICNCVEGPSPFDGEYVVEYDPTVPGLAPNGEQMIAHLVTTPDPAQAKRFDSVEDALQLWRKPHGTRHDGRPNRPLTAFTVTFEPCQ